MARPFRGPRNTDPDYDPNGNNGSGRSHGTIDPNNPNSVDTIPHEYDPLNFAGTDYNKENIDILKSLIGSNGDIDYSAIISLLRQLESTGTKDQRFQLYEQLFQLLFQDEQRQYDRNATNEERAYQLSLLADERSYNSPSAMLTRLLATGMSRDAALQLLSGSGSGGSSALGTGQSNLVGSGENTGVAAQIQDPTTKALNIANTTFNGIQTVASLLSLGFSAPVAIGQATLLATQNALTQQQLGAYNNVSRAYSILSNSGAPAESFGSITNAVVGLTKLAKSGNNAAAQFIAQGGVESLQNDSYFSSRAMADLYRNERASSDYSTSFGKYIEGQQAEIDFKNANKQMFEQQVLNLKEQMQETIASTEFQKSQTALQEYHKQVLQEQVAFLRKQGKEIDANILESKSRVALNEEQAYQMKLQNSVEGDFLDTVYEGKAGLEWLTTSRVTDLYNDCQKFIYAKDKKLWKAELDAICCDYYRATTLNTLRTMYSKGALDRYQNDPKFRDLLNACGAMHEVGAWDYIGYQFDAIDTKYDDQYDIFKNGARKKRDVLGSIIRE